MAVRAQESLFEGTRLQMTDSITLTAASLSAYGETHRNWAVAWSGGKDSSTLLTLLVYLIESGQVAPPESLTVLYADTRLELAPLALAATEIRAELGDRGILVRTVLPPLDLRFLVYMLGRGVPPPKNRRFRWCTRQIKVDPMAAALRELAVARGFGELVPGPSGGLIYRGFGAEKFLVLTGVRQGESAMREGRIAMSCGRDGSECGQGWYQESLPEALCATLAPVLHWRVCHVWEWLRHWAPRPEFGDWSTAVIADAYGGDEAEEINARTGCVGCPLASKDRALEVLLANPRWGYLAPLMGLRPLWRELVLARNRLRKPGGECRQDGSLVGNQHRMGPLTLDARRMALARVLAIQEECNRAAEPPYRPRVDLLDAQEVARIEELIGAGTWPQRWDGEEPRADEPFEEDGQPSLWGLEEVRDEA